MSYALSDRQRVEWLRLVRSEGVGPRTFRQLINRYGGAGAALEALPEVVRKSGLPAARIATEAEAIAEIAALQRMNARLIGLGELEYPRRLAAIDAPPPLITVRGEVAALSRQSVAIVGARNASALGIRFAVAVAKAAAEAGFVVVSGLARGIDAAAHEATVETGTIGVCAGGLAKLYPPEHTSLADAMTRNGAVLSEMPVNWTAIARDFPRRNRLISGLTIGTVVVEAAIRSGSLITARFALEQGREVLAVPGSPLDPRAEGCNRLIQQGATIVTKVSDVIDALLPLLHNAPPPAFRAEEGPRRDMLWDELPGIALADEAETLFDEIELPKRDARATILEALSSSPAHADDIVLACSIPARIVQRTLTELEIEGLARREGAAGWIRNAA